MFCKVAFIICLGLLAVGAEELRTDEEVLREMKESNYTVIGDMIFPSEDDTRSSWAYYGTWPKNTIPYIVSENVTDDLKPVIKAAIDYYHKYTCVKFRPANINDDKYWVRFMMDPSLVKDPNSPVACAAMMGFMKRKDQGVFLGHRCKLVPMLHELEHTLGFNHEHARFDRDDYIAVFFENMQDMAVSQYKREDIVCAEKNRECGFETWGLPFNYDSIMNYCTMCGSKGKKPVMDTLKNPHGMGAIDGSKLGQSHGFSRGDWLAINRKHGCDPEKNPQIPEPPPIPNKPKIDTDRFPAPSKDCKRSKSRS